MKNILTIVLLTLMISCTKENAKTNSTINPEYLGEYNSTDGDTVRLSTNGDYLRIDWADIAGEGKYTFDSVVVVGSTFTDNEYVNKRLWTPPFMEVVTSIGSGTFGSNTIDFEFVIDRSHLKFSGIKK